jgi:hypothetical protein
VGRDKKPLGAGHGHLDASNDPEAIATAFGEFPDAFVGVNAGRSGIVVLDIDLHGDDKDGFASIELNWLGIPETLHYTTPTGGQHHIYRAPSSRLLPPAHRYKGMPGVDRKSDSSYIVYWGPLSDDEITEPPEWLLEEGRKGTGAAYEGELDEWLETLGEGEPSEKVLAAIERIPDTDFGHTEMVERQFELIRLAAEGRQGVRVALDLLREAWLRGPYNTADYAYEYDDALATGIKKFGAIEAKIAGLPSYKASLDRLGAGSVDLLIGEPQGRSNYFYVIRHLVAQPEVNNDEIASLVWSAPTTRDLARDWGIDYLYANIGTARLKANAPIENPSLPAGDPESKPFDLTLLDDEERQLEHCVTTWIDGYMDWVSTKVNVMNEPYHRQNALTVLACAFGSRVFAPLKSRAMGVNLFQIGLGGSSTGKSESISLRDQILRAVFEQDPTYDVGSNPSPEALHETLLKRDQKTSLFNTDEAAAPLDEFLNKSYQAGAVDRLTSYYESYVAPMLRRGQGGATTNQSAVVSFNMAMFGTPERVVGLLSREQFESGFLARFLWTWSADVVADDSQYEESEATERLAVAVDPAVDAFADALGRRSDTPRKGVPVLSDPEALKRLSANRKKMAEALVNHEQWPILQPSI